ncbi:hypothetical protein TTHERM_000620949 (macronuclear) [Tetrahymena thermophila SB210]|uniref:Uncharacterized protein n=1 Tax=Tetrahymena thermophila (strain SB210) TaxID=312017 RepID=W7X993_TETTS|nr:hypothetical protein TTHERM_000620949 [Tetrahymena thermophila SB210]EWS73917.1 hypothetical protein TTHERM_000620949 [Tetrahymena thermophila SB210]|eukprot:XP_012653539.1 hypothetical protein TTHERM_000620949 [Tetrahymena thermophila SB210]
MFRFRFHLTTFTLSLLFPVKEQIFLLAFHQIHHHHLHPVQFRCILILINFGIGCSRLFLFQINELIFLQYPFRWHRCDQRNYFHQEQKQIHHCQLENCWIYLISFFHYFKSSHLNVANFIEELRLEGHLLGDLLLKNLISVTRYPFYSFTYQSQEIQKGSRRSLQMSFQVFTYYIQILDTCIFQSLFSSI